MTTEQKTKAADKTQVRPLDWHRLGRWSLAVLLFALMGAGTAWGVVTLRDPNVLPLKVVRIDGEFRHLKRPVLESAVGRVVRGNFFTVDVASVRRAAEELAWVEGASVRRVWPDTLVMTVTEQQPLARWDADRLVNLRGEIFAPEKSELPAGLPNFSGPDEDAKWVVERFAELNQMLRPLAVAITELAVDGRGSWRVGLGDQLALKLGKVDVDQRLQRFIRIYPELNRDNTKRARMVDLRYTNGLAVKWEMIETDMDQEAESSGVVRNSGTRVRDDKGQV